MKKTLAFLLALVLCMGTLPVLAEVPALKGPGNTIIKSMYQNVAFDPNTDLSAQLIEESTGYQAEYFMLPAENAG